MKFSLNSFNIRSLSPVMTLADFEIASVEEMLYDKLENDVVTVNNSSSVIDISLTNVPLLPVLTPKKSTRKFRDEHLFYYQNMSGMRASLHDFRNDLDNSVYIAALIGETWGKDNILDQDIVPNGWRVIRCDRKDRHSGGVLIAIKGDVSPSEIPIQKPD